MGVPVLSVEQDQRFGFGVVTDPEIRTGRRALRGARLRCDCGQEYEAPIYDLLGERTYSCGCLRKDQARANMALAHASNVRHGLAGHPLMPTWHNMIARCENPAHHNYHRYGGRGIRVCDRWHDPSIFISDLERYLGPKPDGMTLDRICNDHDYRLDNVRYATAEQQGQNKQNTKLTWGDVREIRSRWAQGGITQRALGAEYGVSQTRVSYIVNYKTWRNEPSSEEIAQDLVTLVS